MPLGTATSLLLRYKGIVAVMALRPSAAKTGNRRSSVPHMIGTESEPSRFAAKAEAEAHPRALRGTRSNWASRSAVGGGMETSRAGPSTCPSKPERRLIPPAPLVVDTGISSALEWINLTTRLLRHFSSLVSIRPLGYGDPRRNILRIRFAMAFNPAGERGEVGLVSTGHDQVPQRRGLRLRTPHRGGRSHRRPGAERSPRPVLRKELTRSRSKVVAADGDAILNGATTDPERGTVNSLSEAGCGPYHDQGGLPGRSVSHHGR